MKFTNSNVFLFAPLLCLFMSCGSDVKINFLINGQDLTPSEEQPADLTNMEEILNVFVGDSIIFTDISSPDNNVKQRHWQVNGANDAPHGEETKHFTSVFDTEGIFRIKLCINNSENCISKWLKVDAWGPPMPTNPVVTFTSPAELYNATNQEYIDIEVTTENVFSQEELVLLIKEVNRGFEFDETTGVLSKKVKLGPGENRIEVQALGGDEVISEWVVVNYEKEKTRDRITKDNGNSSTERETEPAKPYIKLNMPPKNFNTLESSVAFAFKTGNLKKNDLAVEVNGNPFYNFQYNQSNRRWEGNLSLDLGPNSIVVRSKDGKVRDESKVTVLKKNSPNTDPIPPPSSAKPLVNIVTPQGRQSKEGQVELTLRTQNMIGPKDLTVLLNGKKVTGLRYAADRRLWVGQLDLQNGKNIIAAEVKNGNGSSQEQISIDYVSTKTAAKSEASTGLNAQNYNSSCSQANVAAYSFSLIPQTALELLEFVVFSNICGGLEINMQSSNGTESFKVELIKGENQILLSDIDARLESSLKYTFSLKTFAGYAGCPASAIPQLEDASNCSLKTISKPQIKMDTQGKSIIYDLKYLY